jgi:hypothetical protein
MAAVADEVSNAEESVSESSRIHALVSESESG